MGSEFSPEKIQQMKDEAHEEMKEILDELRRDAPKVVDTAAAAVGSALGGRALLTTRYFGGIAGLSAAGITSGGAAVPGGGAGAAVIVAFVAFLGTVFGYLIGKKRNAKETAALKKAIEKLYATEERLMENAEYYREELAEIKAYRDIFEQKVRS